MDKEKEDQYVGTISGGHLYYNACLWLMLVPQRIRWYARAAISWLQPTRGHLATAAANEISHFFK